MLERLFELRGYEKPEEWPQAERGHDWRMREEASRFTMSWKGHGDEKSKLGKPQVERSAERQDQKPAR